MDRANKGDSVTQQAEVEVKAPEEARTCTTISMKQASRKQSSQG
jgi:hypothetical protein